MWVENAVFYHVHNNMFAPDTWKVGNTISFTGDKYNFFFDYFITYNLQKDDDSISQEVKIKEYALFIRELVYEEVRLKYFAGLPSREYCLWLCDENSLQFWINTLGEECSVYKLCVTGNIHGCYAGALEDNNINYKILFESAERYWKGEIVGNPFEKEFLFMGEAKIIEKIK